MGRVCCVWWGVLGVVCAVCGISRGICAVSGVCGIGHGVCSIGCVVCRPAVCPYLIGTVQICGPCPES